MTAVGQNNDMSFLTAMSDGPGAPVSTKPETQKPRTVTEDDLLAQLRPSSGGSPPASPRAPEGSMAAMVPPSPTTSAMNEAPEVDPFAGL